MGKRPTRKKTKMTEQQRNREQYSHPENTNLQIYATLINSRIEHLYMEIYDREPTTRAQKRREELALGIF